MCALASKKPISSNIIEDYDGLAVRSATKADKDVIAAAKKLKVIGRAGIGVDNIDIPSATARGIVVMNTPFGNSITTAEHAIALLFAAARQIAAADVSTQAGKWEKNRFMGVELYAKTLGLIGCGNIGALVAERALALKMKVIAYDPFLSPERAVKLGVEKVEMHDLLSRADVISLHTPLTDKTKNILSAEAIANAKRGVIIVNAAPGPGRVERCLLFTRRYGLVWRKFCTRHGPAQLRFWRRWTRLRVFGDILSMALRRNRRSPQPSDRNSAGFAPR